MEKISRTKIVDLMKREDFGAMVNVKGWVRTRRGSKQVNFIALNDGSTGQLMSLITYAMQILMSLMMLSMIFVMISFLVHLWRE